MILISCILYLLCFKKDIDASDGENKYGGRLACANSNASSRGTDGSGFSEGSPFTTFISPPLVR